MKNKMDLDEEVYHVKGAPLPAEHNDVLTSVVDLHVYQLSEG